MTEPREGVPPYKVVYSGPCREQTRKLLKRAARKGRFDKIAQAIEDIDQQLRWIPLDFGEPLRDFLDLGIQVRIASVVPPGSEVRFR